MKKIALYTINARNVDVGLCPRLTVSMFRERTINTAIRCGEIKYRADIGV